MSINIRVIVSNEKGETITTDYAPENYKTKFDETEIQCFENCMQTLNKDTINNCKILKEGIKWQKAF